MSDASLPERRTTRPGRWRVLARTRAFTLVELLVVLVVIGVLVAVGWSSLAGQTDRAALSGDMKVVRDIQQSAHLAVLSEGGQVPKRADLAAALERDLSLEVVVPPAPDYDTWRQASSPESFSDYVLAPEPGQLAVLSVGHEGLPDNFATRWVAEYNAAHPEDPISQPGKWSAYELLYRPAGDRLCSLSLSDTDELDKWSADCYSLDDEARPRCLLSSGRHFFTRERRLNWWGTCAADEESRSPA